MADTNLQEMSRLASNIMHVEDEQLSWFHYGATYVFSLIMLIDFYRSTGRDSEAEDVAMSLKDQAGTANIYTIGKNLLRIGIYLDERECVEAGMQPGMTAEAILDLVRHPLGK